MTITPNYDKMTYEEKTDYLHNKMKEDIKEISETITELFSYSYGEKDLEKMERLCFLKISLIHLLLSDAQKEWYK